MLVTAHVEEIHMTSSPVYLCIAVYTFETWINFRKLLRKNNYQLDVVAHSCNPIYLGESSQVWG